MPRIRAEEDTTLLSFLDTLSNGVGAAILLMLVFGSSAIALGSGTRMPPRDLISATLTTGDAAGLYQLRVERQPTSATPVFVPLHHLRDGKLVSAPRHDPESGLTLWSQETQNPLGTSRTTILSARVPSRQCLGLTLGYQDRLVFDAPGRLVPLQVEIRWGRGSRCCLSATPDYSGGQLWLSSSRAGPQQCSGRPAPDCRCGEG